MLAVVGARDVDAIRCDRIVVGPSHDSETNVGVATQDEGIERADTGVYGERGEQPMPGGCDSRSEAVQKDVNMIRSHSRDTVLRAFK